MKEGYWNKYRKVWIFSGAWTTIGLIVTVFNFNIGLPILLSGLSLLAGDVIVLLWKE